MVAAVAVVGPRQGVVLVAGDGSSMVGTHVHNGLF